MTERIAYNSLQIPRATVAIDGITSIPSMIASADIFLILSYAVTCSSFQHFLVEGVHLPSDISFSVLQFPNLTADVAVVTARFFATYAPQIETLINPNKSDPVIRPNNVKFENDGYAKTSISPVFPEDFGYGKNYLNAFFRASLRWSPIMTFEIDLFGERGSTYFSRFIASFYSMTARFFATYAHQTQILININKSDRFENDGYAKTSISQVFPEDYMHFGYGKNYDKLPHTFKTNAFFMASLRSGSSMTFEIDPFGKHGSTYFSRLIACLDSTVLRVSATFDDSMTKVMDLKVYNSSDPNTELTGYSQESAATLLLHQSSFYAQNVHTVIHVSKEIADELKSALHILIAKSCT